VEISPEVAVVRHQGASRRALLDLAVGLPSRNPADREAIGIQLEGSLPGG